MLSSVYRDAVRRRERTLSILHDSSYEMITREAKNSWVTYRPKKSDSDIIGIDSSYNSVKYQGIDLWVVTAVAVRADNAVCCDMHESGLGQTDSGLSQMAGRMESAACKDCLKMADLILMDGSIHSKVLEDAAKKGATVPQYCKNPNVIFVSKNSDTKDEFAKYGSAAGDIFYYNRASREPGYSSVRVDARYGTDAKISSSFLRLSESQPLLKIEVFGRLDGERMQKFADRMYKNSVMGYPYSLRLAHQNCKISSDDMQRFARLHGLLNETGSREVLE